MSDAIVQAPEITEEAALKILMAGDLSSLTKSQQGQFLYQLAVSQGLNPMTQPFNLIVLNNKLTVYANRTAADQLRKIHGVTTEKLYSGYLRVGPNDYDRTCWEVEYKLTDKTGRIEYSTGCVGVENLKGEALGNACMKCDTKAKRRGTLSLCGLGFLDELEVESVQNMKMKEENIGVGAPRRVLPKPPAPTVVEATVVEEPPLSQFEPSEIKSMAGAAKIGSAPPAFSKPLPSVKPPINLGGK